MTVFFLSHPSWRLMWRWLLLLVRGSDCSFVQSVRPIIVCVLCVCVWVCAALFYIPVEQFGVNYVFNLGIVCLIQHLCACGRYVFCERLLENFRHPYISMVFPSSPPPLPSLDTNTQHSLTHSIFASLFGFIWFKWISGNNEKCLEEFFVLSPDVR